ncbi:hypothetical protein [Sphingomonas colocasiae]|uniref:Uncharacterized protein n=1 Tax=Sphingomonas colocasiae TaxID=1848973 RepID=A0ABS7PVB1_9SPHN|nr:hypothetical protein [Sphingomonas colocasiae]MBY8824595.1 hypothetical protein [Sphingomonas colocasiae]
MQGFLTIGLSILVNASIVAGMFPEQRSSAVPYQIFACGPTGPFTHASRTFNRVDRIDLPYLASLNEVFGLDFSKFEGRRNR